jgi:protein involved in polysaccharide export with SLBB domain
MLAASIRQRLRNGDFRDGDRIVVSMFSDALHTDTLLVRSGGVLDLPGNTALHLAGVLRSELREKVEGEVLKYIKAEHIEVVPLMRVGVTGQVVRPGYFAVRSDIPITEAIMLAGGPTGAADVQRSTVRRGTQEYRSPTDTREAISRGLTLDQFGLSAGDELVVGKERGGIGSSFLPWVGAAASLVTVFVALHRR